MNDPAIAIAPYLSRFGKHLARLPLDNLRWPMGRPDRLRQGTVADMAPTDHLICFPRSQMHYLPSLGCPAQLSVAVVEPAAFHGRHLRYLRWTHRRFFRVFSYNEPLLEAIPNGVMLPFGTTWVPVDGSIDTNKTRRMSLIASAKRDLPGHLLRHELVSHIREENLDVEVLGRGYVPFEDKADGLAPYKFSVVIENVQEPHYFTEKLIDAILCETVPIYWGCRNIEDFIDPSCMIRCNTKEELIAAIQNADDEMYQERIEALRAARDTALHWADLNTRAATALLNSL